MTKKKRIHLDASALLSCILAKAHNKLQRKTDKDEVNYGNKLLYKLKNEKEKNSEIEVVISSEALGEILSKLLENNRDDKQGFVECMSALWDIFQELGPDYAPARKEANEIAIKIAEKDDRISFSDCQIAACASDSDSVALVTTDKDLIESKVLTEIDKELREKEKRRGKLNITEYSD